MENKSTVYDASSSACPARMYSKIELSQLYFPQTNDKAVARHHLMAWIKGCPELWAQLQELGYRNRCQFFSPRMVRLIMDYLGEPSL